MVTLVAVLATMALSGCSPPPPPPALPPAVYVTPVVNDRAPAERVLFATVQPRVQTDVAFRVGGKVTLRAVEVGQAVRAGQVLARLDSADLGLALQAAQDQQRAAQADARQAAADAARAARLQAEGFVGPAEAERQQARADAAAARLAQAERQAALAGNRSGYAVLVAPFNGIVTALRLETGQVVGENQPVLTLARPAELELEADVPEALAPILARWQAQARVAGLDGAPLALRLRALAPAADPGSRTYRARYALAEPAAAARLRMGATAELWLADPSARAGAELPVGALLAVPPVPQDPAAIMPAPTAAVWLADPATGTLTRQAVTLLSQARDRVRVAGLPDGALVVSVGAQRLDAGLTVRPVARPLDPPLPPPAPRPLAAAGQGAAPGVR